MGSESVEEGDKRGLSSLCRDVIFAPVSLGQPARAMRVARAIATRRAVHASYFASRSAADRLNGWLVRHEVDVVVVDQLWMYGYLPPTYRSVAVLDCHNVEARRISTMANAPVNRPRRTVARLQLPAVQRYEAAAVRSVARTLAVSDVEFRDLDALAPGRVRLVPNGVDTTVLRRLKAVPRTANLLFLGSLDYSANADGARYLIGDILPKLKCRDAEAFLVGPRPPRTLRALAARAPVRTKVIGYVQSTDPFWARSRMLVAPLRFGGGTRLKILEALARGVPVVATTLGCEGLELEHERNVIIADSAAAFADWIDRLLSDDALCCTLSREGRRTVEERYDWRMIGGKLDDAMRELIAATPV
jgi:glycosyltransferase involved in cell wall biosynthesis